MNSEIAFLCYDDFTFIPNDDLLRCHIKVLWVDEKNVTNWMLLVVLNPGEKSINNKIIEGNIAKIKTNKRTLYFVVDIESECCIDITKAYKESKNDNSSK